MVIEEKKKQNKTRIAGQNKENGKHFSQFADNFIYKKHEIKLVHKQEKHNHALYNHKFHKEKPINFLLITIISISQRKRKMLKAQTSGSVDDVKGSDTITELCDITKCPCQECSAG